MTSQSTHCIRTLALGLVCLLADHALPSEYLSPGVLVPSLDGKALYVAEATANEIAVFDIETRKVTRAFELPNRPSGLALSSDGTVLFVTGGVSEGQVHCVSLETGKITGSITVGHTPLGPVTSPDGRTLYACNRFTNDISIVDVTKGTELTRIAVTREPVAAAIAPDGKSLLVANHLPTGSADRDYVSAVVSVIDTAAGKVVTAIALPNGSTGLRGICVSPDGKYAYVTHILARYQLPTTQLERGWMNTNAMSIIDVAARKLVNTVLLDDVDLGAANPWGVVCTSDGKHICVAHAGTHELSIIDQESLHQKLAKVAKGQRVSEVSARAEDVPNDLSFLVALRRRVRLGGTGPHGVACVGGQAYVAEYFSDSLGVVDVTPRSYARPLSIPLGQETEMSTVRRGELFFNDARLCFQQWQSCASCHPDARADALNWDLLNDGMGNPKQTKSLLLSHKTPPVMVSGVRDKAETAVRAGIRYIQFAVVPDERPAGIDAYLASLKPVPSPFLAKGQLSPRAERGRKLFSRAGCAACHTPPLLTNLKQFNVGIGSGLDQDRAFDTPTLVEVWRTAPYLYDGRSGTMADVLTKHNPGDRHGVTSSLKPDEITNLAEFILSQ